MKSRRNQGGFTLIEVLVSALILAIGLVGVAGLQAMSLKNNQSAYMRTQANALAYDFVDRMRTNVAGANAGFYNPADAAAVANCNTAVGCTAQEMAQNDFEQWNLELAASLPMGEGFVCIDSTPDDGAGVATPNCDGAGNLFAVKLWWDNDRDGVIQTTLENTERLIVQFQL